LPKALGAPAQVFALALSDSIQLCVRGSVYAEYEEVLRRSCLERGEEVITGALDTIREKGSWVRPSQRVNVCSDSDDNMFL